MPDSSLVPSPPPSIATASTGTGASGSPAASPARLRLAPSGPVVPFRLTARRSSRAARSRASTRATATNVSPALSWSGVPAGAGSLVLLVDDPDAKDFVHWIVLDMPATPPAGALPRALDGVKTPPRQGRNDFGDVGYGGPCPPSGTHQYRFVLYALAAPLGVAAGANGTTVRSALGDGDDPRPGDARGHLPPQLTRGSEAAADRPRPRLTPPTSRAIPDDSRRRTLVGRQRGLWTSMRTGEGTICLESSARTCRPAASPRSSLSSSGRRRSARRRARPRDSGRAVRCWTSRCTASSATSARPSSARIPRWRPRASRRQPPRNRPSATTRTSASRSGRSIGPGWPRFAPTRPSRRSRARPS